MVQITPPPLSPQSMADLLCTMVLLCTGQDEYDRNFWAYICIKPSMAEPFRIAREQGNFNLGEYGTIIEAGEGTAPPAEVKTRMERDYGVSDNYEEELLRSMYAIRSQQNLHA